MAVFSICDGRTAFWQWDLGQQLVVSDPGCHEVHFCNGTSDCALVCKVFEENGKRLVNVPNLLLQTGAPLRIFAYIAGDGRSCTAHCEVFSVLARTKPADYIYTETEIFTVTDAVTEALEAAKAAGDFKGEPGTDGEPGYTPVKGIDYFTASDKAEMVEILKTDLPVDSALSGDSKNPVQNKVIHAVLGNVDTALDGILALQATYIGGDSA